MDSLNFFESFTTTQFIRLALLQIGVLVLIYNIYNVAKFSKVLKHNHYTIKKWVVVIILFVIFIVGYCIDILDIFNIYKLPINSGLMMSLTYFVATIFYFVLVNSTSSLVKNILGDVVSDDIAFKIALKRININKEELEHLFDKFEINCESCNKNYVYSLADIVRQHYKLSDKGINVETTFGVKSLILRPTHKCTEGRREIIVIHDSNMAYRSIDHSRIILGNSL